MPQIKTKDPNTNTKEVFQVSERFNAKSEKNNNARLGSQEKQSL